MKHKLVPTLLAATAGLALLSGIGVAAASDGGSRRPPEAEAQPFDPVAAALGVDTAAERAQLIAGQEELAGKVDSLGSNSVVVEPGGSVQAVESRTAVEPGAVQASLAVRDWNVAIDELYERVAKDKGAAPIRERWLKCMGGLGYDLTDRVQVVKVLNDPETSESQVLEIGAHIDQCDALDQAALDTVVKRQLPGWEKDHAQAIAAYKQALGLAGA